MTTATLPVLAKPQPPSPSSMRPRLSAPLALLTVATTLFLVPFLAHPRAPVHHLLSSSSPRALRAARPLLVYPKPRKTGSTFVSSMLGNAVLRAGGRIAPCKVAGLMTPHAAFYGLVRDYDLLGCHTGLASISVPALLRLNRDVVFLTSIREPRSWFASAAVWVYEKKNKVVVDSESLFRKAVDEALGGAQEFSVFRRLFLGNYGLDEAAGTREVEGASNVYSYVFDHATAENDVNDALVELGFEPSKPSSRREGLYDPKWFGGYRTEDVQNATRLEQRIYDHFSKVRGARMGKQVPWASLERNTTKVVYSALSSKVSQEKTAATTRTRI